jgi:hypothetical protein
MNSTLPFALGTTYYGADQTIDVSSSYANVIGQHLEGSWYESKDVDPSNPGITRSGNLVKTRVVRNVSGVTLQGKYAVKYSTKFKRIDGYTRLDVADVAGIVDPYLPSTGVRDGDLCHIVVDGPCIIKTPKTGAAFGTASWAAGDDLVAVTDAAANATTTTAGNQAGRLQGVTSTWTATQATDGTALAYNRQIMAEVITARTSGETSTDTLVAVRIPR